MMSGGSSLRVFVVERAEASRSAAALLAEELAAASPVLGLATGSSVEAVYEELAARVAVDAALQAGVARAQAFALDEYLGLPAGDPNSYRATLLRQFAEPLGFDSHRLHVPSSEPAANPLSYDIEIAAAGGVGVQLLGIGGNGHIGFNEPGSPLDSRTRIVELDDRTRQDNARFFSSPDRVPSQAVTQGIGTILQARRLVVLAFGAAKAQALSAALDGPVTERLPASALQRHPDVVVFADAQAAALSLAHTRS